MTDPVQLPSTAGVVDTGPLDWRIGITDRNGRPTPEFQRRWNAQRSNNNLIRTIPTGHGPPVATDAVQNQVYIDIDATPHTIYIFNNGTWETVGVINFTDLKDVPHSYTGAGLSFLQVDNTEDALIFIGLSGALDQLGSPAQGDILYRGTSGWVFLPPGTTGDVLTTGGPAADPLWTTPTSTTGTVTSVGLAAPSIFTVSGSPVTTIGTLTFALNTATANMVFAGPATGSPAVPTFRSLVPSDLPLFSSSVNGAVPASGGGTTNFLRADGTWAAAGGSGGTPANPTATASDTAVNGTATTYMRSDAAPAVQKASPSVFGLVKVDGTTITASGGVISAVGGGGGGGSSAPLVNGDNPVGLIADGVGQTITVPLSTGVSSLVTSYLLSGLSSALPVSPSIDTGCTAVYFATDTHHIYLWTGSTWQVI